MTATKLTRRTLLAGLAAAPLIGARARRPTGRTGR